jgi:hypothetical protein
MTPKQARLIARDFIDEVSTASDLSELMAIITLFEEIDSKDMLCLLQNALSNEFDIAGLIEETANADKEEL